MLSALKVKLKDRARKIVNSIAFYPAAIGLFFLFLSFASIEFDFSETGKRIKSSLHWLSLRDATTARSIISSIVSGVISLTVFSFSMVMIVLNQAASQMSNRVLDKLIGNRFQQMVLGIYIGTIVYALFLLSTIRDIDSGIYIPALSTYLLIVVTVFDIFLFIYFLHYITQSVKYEVIIDRIYDATRKSLLKACYLKHEQLPTVNQQPSYFVNSAKSGIFENFNSNPLLEFCGEHNCMVYILPKQGSFVLKGNPVIEIDKILPEKVQEQLLETLNINTRESVDGNFFYGFKQLMEVAIKALSPGINDPDTAVISLRAMFRLYAYRICFFPETIICNEEGITKIFVEELTFENIFSQTLLPVWDYGKNDRIIGYELASLLKQLQFTSPTLVAGNLLLEVQQTITQKYS